MVTFAFKSLRGIKYSQVAQIAPGTWEIRIVPESTFGDSQRQQLVDNVKHLVDPGLEVVVRVVSEIARTSAHKYRWIVNESKSSRSSAAGPDSAA